MDNKLDKKSVKETIDKGFKNYWVAVGKSLMKLGYPQLEASSFAMQVSNSIETACINEGIYQDLSDIGKTIDAIQKAYIQKFTELVTKEQARNRVDKDGLIYYSGEAYRYALETHLKVNFGKGIRRLPGCYGHSDKKGFPKPRRRY